MENYVSLHNHTCYSLMHSLIKPNDLFAKVKNLHQPAVGITDSGTMFAAWDGLKASKKTGVKLIIGCEFFFTEDLDDENSQLTHLVLIAKNHQGYKNLLLALKLANENFVIRYGKVIPRIDWNILEKCSDGIIVLTACGEGLLSYYINTRRSEESFKRAKKLKDIFGENLALEVQPHAMIRQASPFNDYEDQTLVNNKLIKFGQKLDIKVVATCDAHYLEKNDWEAHDALVAIGSGVPIRTRFRLQYTAHDFYLKTRDEIVKFFQRKGYANAEEFCDNTVFFADMCEDPEWIDPKYSNPSGAELPSFPVKNQSDYQQFLNWLSNKDNLKDKPEDDNYLRYCCEKGLKKINKDQDQEYLNRVEKELDTFEFRNLASYMLIVSDYVNWAKSNNLPTGPGRGCLTGKSLVLTKDGFVRLDKINKNDMVYTHTGELKRVLNTFKYNVEKEDLMSIKTEFSFNDIILTKDHHIYAIKRKLTKKYQTSSNPEKTKKWEAIENSPSWIPASELSIGDVAFMPFPKRKVNTSLVPKQIDLVQFFENYEILNDTIITKFPLTNELSIKKIAKATGISLNCLRNIKLGKFYSRKKSQIAYTKLKKYLNNFNLSIDNWINDPNNYKKIINRYLNIDDNFLYFIGRFIGDGWIRSYNSFSDSYQGGIAFHSDDEYGINKITNYLKDLGIEVYKKYSKKKKLCQIIINGKYFYNLIKFILPDYKHTSNTKHLPVFFRHLSEEQLKHLLQGVIESDGHITFRENIDTTSLRLACELKELCLYLKIQSSITTRKPFWIGSYLCKESYKIRFRGLNTNSSKTEIKFENGYYVKILDIKNKSEKFVYDLNVEEDHSYITSNYAVHNSAGGSLVAYLLGIHDADSIKYGLIFERFYNKTKVGFSDIDCDFGQSAKPLVQKYIEEKYGSDYVAHISNINTITPKVYARDLARAFEFGGSRESAVEIGTAIADSISDDCKTIKSALVNAPLFQEFAEVTEYAPLKKLAPYLEGLPRAQATHAGGIVIGKRPLYEIVPIRKDKENEWVLEYEKDRAEDNGLVKMDVLGLSTLDIIENTLQIIKSRGKELPSLPWNYDENDKKAYELIGRGDTYGVFQLGTSAGTKDLCIKMKPKNIEDLAMINSMARPGFPKEIREEFMLTKHKGIVANLVHPILKNSLSKTFGYALFDEVLLQLANDVAGWDLAEADRLRKFIKEKGKYPEKDQKLKEDFINGAINNKKLSKEEADLIWDKVVGNFGAYIFNKAHAIEYSFISYQTAYLKAHYPAEFLTANLIFEDSSGAKVADKNKKILKREIRSLGIKVLPPDVNKSDNVYKILNNNSILTGFSSLKYMGNDAIPELLEKRPYYSFEELLSKTDGKKVRITAIQALAASGALDSFGLTRKQMFLYASDYRKKLQAWQKRKTDKPFNYPWPEDIGEWSISEKYAMEVYYLGEAFCCGIKEAYGDFFDNWALDFSKLPDIFPDPGDSTIRYELSLSDGIIEGVITDYFEFKVKNEKSKIFGEIMAKISLEDIYGNIIYITLFPSGLEHLNDRLRALTGNKTLLEVGTAIKIMASANWYDGDISLIFSDLIDAVSLPSKPKELKHQKVTMKIPAKTKKKTNKINADNFLNQIEDEMIFEGLIDDVD